MRLTLDDWHDSALLNSRWALETVGVNSTEELWLEVHAVERIDGLIVVGLDLSCEVKVSSYSHYITAQRMRFAVARWAYPLESPLILRRPYLRLGLEDLDYKRSL